MPAQKTRSAPTHIFFRLHPLQRIFVSLVLTFVAWLLIRNSGLKTLVQLLSLWDVFAFGYIGTTWVVFFSQTNEHIQRRARVQDGSRVFVFLLILLASFASMFTVLQLQISKDTEQGEPGVFLLVTIAGMLLSWIMVHTTFAAHYAYLYYYDSTHDADNRPQEGLEFPGKELPDYLDFAYFSFVIGMTFQVSDVEISARAIRRVALAHGLLSFGLNTFVVALTVNLIAGLKA